MDKYEKRREALGRLIARFGRGGITRVAHEIGKEPNYVSRMLYPPGKRGRKRIGEESVDALNEKFPGWMEDTGEHEKFLDETAVISSASDPVPNGYVRLEHLPYQPSMGRGRAQTIEHIVQHIDVLESFVRQKVGTVSAERIKILTGVGTSMMPRIKDQDIVFVDIEHRWIDAPGYYVIDVGGLLLLKKAMILSTGVLILRSENVEEFPDEERHDLRKAAETITVCGKVLAWWTLMQG